MGACQSFLTATHSLWLSCLWALAHYPQCRNHQNKIIVNNVLFGHQCQYQSRTSGTVVFCPEPVFAICLCLLVLYIANGRFRMHSGEGIGKPVRASPYTFCLLKIMLIQLSVPLHRYPSVNQEWWFSACWFSWFPYSSIQRVGKIAGYTFGCAPQHPYCIL